MTNRVSQGQEQPSVSWSRITPPAVRQTFSGTARIASKSIMSVVAFAGLAVSDASFDRVHGHGASAGGFLCLDFGGNLSRLAVLPLVFLHFQHEELQLLLDLAF